MNFRGLLYKARTALADPGKIGSFIRARLNDAAYYLGSGARARLPLEIVLYVNSACNARCLMCDVGQHAGERMFHQQLIRAGGGELPVDACRELFTEVGGFGPTINLNGLEPLLHHDILDIVSAAKERGLQVKLVTNGILLPEFAAGLVERGLDVLVVSLDGPEPVHDLIRGPGVYRRAVDGILLVKRYKSAAGGRGPAISINYCLTDRNYDCLAAFAAEMLEKVGVERIRVSHFNYVTPQAAAEHNRLFGRLGKAAPAGVGAVDPQRIDLDVLWTQMRLIEHKYPGHRVRFSNELKTRDQLAAYYRQPERIVTKRRCLTPWRITTILANGDVVVRNRCFPFTVGNIHHQSLREIWNGERYRLFRRELKRAGLFPVCRRCCGTF